MLVKYIDSNYIIETLQKPSWGEVEEPDFYITMASNRVKALIFPSEQGDPNNLASYTEEQQEAIKLATAIYTLWYFDTNYDFTNGSVSVNFGGVSMSESKTYNGEMVLPNVFDILKQANLIPTTETFIFSGENNLYADTAINPKSFKDLQQEVERQADVNIKQDAKLVALNDAIANIDGLKTEIWDIQAEQQEQDTKILTNTNKITTLQNTITPIDTKLTNTTDLLNQTIERLRTLKPFQYVGQYQAGTTYNINQVVSFNNNLYLSTEDNNTTQPPTDKWLLLNEDMLNIDLTEYYTKLEVDNIKNDLQNDITANRTEIARVDSLVNTNSQQIADLNGRVNVIQSDVNSNRTDITRIDGVVNANTTNITTNTNNINRLDNEVVKISGNQTITGAKTFDNQVVIRKDGTPLTLRAINPGKIYMIMKGADDATNFSLGANSSNTSLEVNRGDLTIKTAEANKNVNFENVARIKFNRSVLEVGTEINAGFGGGEVKFIPEDNTTKTLQFYNGSPSDQRRFKLLVPEPAEPQNPATKQYVDSAISNNRVDTSNFATLNTNQTISGQKTFSNAIQITKTNAALQFKPGTNQSGYLEFYNGNTRIAHFGKGSSSSNNLNLAAQSGQLLIEASQGVVARSPIEFGTEIKAGYGGLNVKFIPEDNSTKTLQFYNSQPADQRRFNLLIPEPTQANNPATKNYVDSAISTLQTNGNLGLNLRYQDLVVPAAPTRFQEGNTVKYWFTSIAVPETKFLSAVVNYQGQSNAATFQKYWDFSYSVASGSKVYFHFTADKNTNYQNNTPNWGQTKIRIFYIDSLNTRNNEPYTIADERG